MADNLEHIRVIKMVLVIDFVTILIAPFLALYITNLKKSSQLATSFIKDSQTRYRELIDNSPDNIMLLNTAGYITYVNDASEITGGYLREDIVGKHIAQAGFFNPSDLPAYMQIVAKVLSGQKIEGVEMNFVSKSGRPMVAQVSAGVIKTAGQISGLQAVWRDVTEIKKNEKRITDLNEVLKILNKIMRHDLLNDLTVMQGNLHLYLDYGEPKDVTELLTEINKTVDRSKDLIDQMRGLENSVTTGEALVPIDVVSIIETVIKEFPELKTTVVGSATIQADPAFSSIVVNLFRNAVRHGKASKMLVDIKSHDQSAVISFGDDGRGIPDEIKPKLFFEGAKFGDTGNTGLGLYIIKKTIERYGGSVAVKDNTPSGALFILTVPLSVASSPLIQNQE